MIKVGAELGEESCDGGRERAAAIEPIAVLDRGADALLAGYLERDVLRG